MTTQHAPEPLSIRVSPDLVVCAAAFMSVDETRYYLNGIYFEPSPKGGVIVVATDGHTMIVLHDPDGEANRPAIVAVQPSFVSKVRSEKRKRRTQNEPAVIEIKSLEDTPWLNTIEVLPHPLNRHDHIIYHVAEIDGKYPDWRRVVPKKPQRKSDGKTDQVPSVASRYIERAGKALKTLGVERDGGNTYSGVMFHPGDTPSDPVVLTSRVIAPGFVVLMPMRDDTESLTWSGPPDFMTEDKAA